MVSKLNKAQEIFNSNKQRFITYVCYVGIVVVSVLASCLSVVFGIKDNFDSSRFITNLCLNIAFAILALILAWKDGEMSFKQRKKGPLFEITQMFKQSVRLIVDADGFRQWNDVLYERERKDYIMTELASVQVFDYEYLLISDEDLESLKQDARDDIKLYTKESGKIETITLDQITDLQFEVITVFRQGKFDFPKIPYTFFKTQENVNAYKKYAKEADRNRKTKIWALIYRVAMILIFSAIFALAIINPNQSDGKQIAVDTALRIFNMCSSMFMGYSLAHDEEARLIDSLGYKVGVITDYITDLDTGVFVPMSRSAEINKKITDKRNEIKLQQQKEEENRLKELEAQQEEQKPEPKKDKKRKKKNDPQQDQEEIVLEMTEEEMEAKGLKKD